MVTDSASPILIVALHCSGAGAKQWSQLREILGEAYELVAPEHYGCKETGPWTGVHAFTLADEAVRTLEIIDTTDRKVHLIGHSYGGGLALHVALERPNKIASLTLYEPSAFHLLKQIEGGANSLADILAITRQAGDGVITGNYRAAAAAFVDFWSGKGTWSAMPSAVQRTLTHWAPKAPLDFAALLAEPTQAIAYSGLHFPVLIIRGEHAPAPTRLIAEGLVSLLPNARPAVISGAGHMGPLTHTTEVNAIIARHVEEICSRHPTLNTTPTIEGHGEFSAAGAAL